MVGILGLQEVFLKIFVQTSLGFVPLPVPSSQPTALNQSKLNMEGRQSLDYVHEKASVLMPNGYQGTGTNNTFPSISPTLQLHQRVSQQSLNRAHLSRVYT